MVCQDSASGYRGIIAIHSTVLGPALGGTRFWSYASDEDAIVDALRLARGMTYKNAVAGLNLGGGPNDASGQPGYVALLRELSSDLHARGMKLYVAVPPHNGEYDYGAVSAAADGVVLMNYDEHYPGGTSGPVLGQDGADLLIGGSAADFLDGGAGACLRWHKSVRSYYFRPGFFLPATVRFGPLRVRALVRVRWPRTGRPRRWRMPA